MGSLVHFSDLQLSLHVNQMNLHEVFLEELCH